VDPVATRERQPAELRQPGDRPVHRRPVGRLADLDGGQHYRLSTQGLDPPGQVAGLVAGPGDQHRLAEQRPGLEPGDPLAQRHDLADDDDRGRLDLRAGGGRGQVAQGGGDGPLPGGAARARWRRPVCRAACRAPAGRQRWPPGGRCPCRRPACREPRQGGPVDQRVRLVWLLVPGDQGDGAGVPPVRQRDAGARRRPQGGRDAGDDLVADPRLAEGLGLLGAAAEDHRVAALEPDDAEPRPGGGDHGFVDERQAVGVAAGQLIDAEAAGRRRGVLEHLDGHEPVIEHQVGLAQALGGAEGQEPRVAGPGADQKDRGVAHEAFTPRPARRARGLPRPRRAAAATASSAGCPARTAGPSVSTGRAC